mmetsp:Transcript_16373/g.53319  ORF Transcript_16373/g.53319 Transcript_16373/m.53319 type:complete len:226 (-) Transcript_16373:120-797(-)
MLQAHAAQYGVIHALTEHLHRPRTETRDVGGFAGGGRDDEIEQGTDARLAQLNTAEGGAGAACQSGSRLGLQRCQMNVGQAHDLKQRRDGAVSHARASLGQQGDGRDGNTRMPCHLGPRGGLARLLPLGVRIGTRVQQRHKQPGKISRAHHAARVGSQTDESVHKACGSFNRCNVDAGQLVHQDAGHLPVQAAGHGRQDRVGGPYNLFHSARRLHHGEELLERTR